MQEKQLEESLKAFSEVYEENKHNLKSLSREVELVESSIDIYMMGSSGDRKSNSLDRLALAQIGIQNLRDEAEKSIKRQWSEMPFLCEAKIRNLWSLDSFLGKSTFLVAITRLIYARNRLFNSFCAYRNYMIDEQRREDLHETFPKTAKGIVEEYLKKNGYDGLYSVYDQCECLLGDIMPCTCKYLVDILDSCYPGYRQNVEGCKICGTVCKCVGEKKPKTEEE